MKKLIILVVAGVLLAAGAAAGVRESGVVGASPCQKPLTFLNTDQNEAVKAIDTYVSTKIAPLYKHPDQLNWIITAPPGIKPNHLSLAITVGEQPDPFGMGIFFGASREYRVELTRSCATGPWQVVEFKRLSKAPEPLAGKAGKKPE